MQWETVDAKAEHRAHKGYTEPKLNYTTHYDIPYVPKETVTDGLLSKNMLDIYRPCDPAGAPSAVAAAAAAHSAQLDSIASQQPTPQHNKLPVVIFVHGGGWKRFDRRSAVTGMHGNVGIAFAQSGFVSAVISYRLSFIKTRHFALCYSALSLIIGCIVAAVLVASAAYTKWSYAIPLSFLCPLAFGALHWIAERSRGERGCKRIFSAEPVHHPTHCQDAAAAVAWVIANIDKYGGDPNNICIMGHSAGGHIVSMLAVQPKFMAEAGAPDAFSKNIKAVACLSGVYDAELLQLKGAPWYLCASRQFRRVWFLHPAFGPNEETWQGSFASGICADEQHLTSLHLPPMLLVNASNDLGLNEHTTKFGAQLLNGGFSVRQVVLKGCNHIDYVMGMGKQGWLGDVVVLPRLVQFFRQYLVPAESSCNDIEDLDVSIHAETGITQSGAGAMPT